MLQGRWSACPEAWQVWRHGPSSGLERVSVICCVAMALYPVGLGSLPVQGKMV